MERLLIRVPLLLVEWLNPIGSGATCIIPQKTTALNPTEFLVSNGDGGRVIGATA